MKKTTIRKITAALLCALLLLSAPMGTNLPGGFPLTASAAGYSGTCGENLTWTLNTTTGLLTITGTGEMEDYDYFSNPPWYSNRSSIWEVRIANSVTSIGERAFWDCTSLTSVNIPDSVTSIGNRAFYDTEIYNNASNWENDVLYIGNHLIKAETSITGDYLVKSGTKTIADEAFYDCTGLTSVTIPDSVTSIGNSAFYRCTSLTSVSIPDSVTSIGDLAFYGCTSLTSIMVNEGNPNYSCDEYGVLLNKDKTLLIQYPIGNTRTSYTIPDSVMSIGIDAFHSCTALTGVIIPDSVTTIGKDAFAFSTALKSIYIPDSVTEIGQGAFAGCTALRNATLPNNMPSIVDSLFASCSSLESITIPNSVTSIGHYAFFGCQALTDITIPSNVTSIGCDAFSECNGLTSIVIPESVTSISTRAFYKCTALTSISLPDEVIRFGEVVFFETGLYNDDSNWTDGVLYIGHHLIEAKSSITGSYTIKTGTKNIAEWAFYDCSSLTTIIIPNSVTSIGYELFTNCSSLIYVHIPDSVTEIRGSILYNSPAYICSDTAECYAKEYAEANGIEFRVCSEPNTDISGTCGENLTWTLNTTTGILAISGTGEMKDYDYFSNAPWYSNRSSIREVQIANGVTSIGEYAFYNCSSLTSVTIPDSVTSIGYNAFRNCTHLTSVAIPDSVTSIGDLAFDECTSLTSVTIPDSVTSIGDLAFYGCTSLTSITVKEGNPKYSSDEYGVLLNKDKTMLIQYPVGNTRTSYTIPDSVTSIGKYAFYHCTCLTSVTIPDSVTSIGNYAFWYCTSLTSVTIPDSVTSIGDYAFSFCTSLTSVTIPDSVTSIGERVFWYCISLTSITVKEGNPKYSSDEYGVLLNKDKTMLIQYPVGNTRTSYTIPDSVTSIGDSVFAGCTSLTSVTIPDGVTSIGADAFADCSSLNYVHIPASVTSIGESILAGSPAYICSDTAECYAKEYAEANGIEFRVCDGHGAAEPEPPKFDGTTGTVQADCTPGCFDEDAHLVVSESDKTLPEFGITVSGYVQVQKTYNIQVQNAHGQPLQPKSGHTVTLRLPLPLDDHGNPYDAGKYSVYHLIDNDPANTESFRAKKGNLKIENGFLVIEVSHFSPFVVVVESEMPMVSIAGNPGTLTLRYNETLVLHAEAENLPDGASLLWEADKDGIVELKPSEDGTTCEVISKKTGNVRITVKVVDADGSEIEGSGSDTETVQSKAGFFQKLLAFFRLLFGIKVRIDQRKK